MADTKTVDLPNTDPLPGPAFGGQTGIDPSLVKDLGNLERQKITAEGGAMGALSGGAAYKDVQQQYKAEGASLNDPALRPWNEKEEQAKYQTDPIMAFGSLGSVFGILASAFTHAPMQNALNASAAAINAIKKGDRQGYLDAQKAWENNYKLALERNKLQHEHYQSAIELMKVNMAAGAAKLKVLAAQYDDKKALLLLEHGMSPELFQLMDAREKLAGDMAKNQATLLEHHADEVFLISHGYNPAKPEDPANLKAFEEWKQWKQMQKVNPLEMLRTEETARHNKVMEGIDVSKAGGEKAREDEIIRHNKAMEDIYSGRAAAAQEKLAEEARHHKATEKIQEKKVTTGGVMTESRRITQQAAAFRSEQAKLHPDMPAAQLDDMEARKRSELKQLSAGLTGNRLDELRGKQGQIKLALRETDEIDKLLLAHNAITGVGGMLTRPVEVISNIMGGSETDRKQFQRAVEEMKLLAPRILLDSKGRPISAEAAHVEHVIAGLAPGDTSANSIRAYLDMREQLLMLNHMLEERMGVSAPESSKPAPSSSDDWYKSAPVVH